MAVTEPSRERQRRQRFWRYGRILVAPVLIWSLLAGLLSQPLLGWLHSEEQYDKAAMQEWLEESRNPDKTLAQLVAEYQARARKYADVKQRPDAPLRSFDA